MCGDYTQDCSCNPECKQKGNCCFDYVSRQCEFIIENALGPNSSKCKKNLGCKFCSDSQTLSGDVSIPFCLQCDLKYFKYKGRCYKSCPNKTQADVINRVCTENSKIIN